MPDFLCLSVRFLQPSCHARGERAEPEWPPSPLRVFQALTAAAAARWNERSRLERAAPALRWLEGLPPPVIVAPRSRPSAAGYRLYVPDNVGDKVAASWARGGSASIADYRTEKDVRPTLLEDNAGAVHYLWPLPAPHPGPELAEFTDVLIPAARSITHLGWGVDMVVADAAIRSARDADALDGERWLPTEGPPADGPGLRVPVAGTLDALIDRHGEFLDRIGPGGTFRPVAPLSAYRVLGYRCSTDPAQPDIATFGLLQPDGSRFRAFDPARRVKIVAGMLRDAARRAGKALGWDASRIASFVLGHGEPSGSRHIPVRGPRLAYLPLPSIEGRGPGRARVVGSVRRALLTVAGGSATAEFRQLVRILSGFELIDERDGQPAALLSRLPDAEAMVRNHYVGPAATWSTVTPVVLPGHDDPRRLLARLPREDRADSHPDSSSQKRILDRLDRRIDALLRKAIRQAGLSDDLARCADIQYRSAGFLPGTDLARAYLPPEKIGTFRRLHVRITWMDTHGSPVFVRGPLCLGGGRYSGLGLFAARAE
jgi:CRISPR-associated protein Csb2